jgi:hypothetical protein
MPHISTQHWAAPVTISYTLYCKWETCEKVAKNVEKIFPDVRASDDTKYGHPENIAILEVEYPNLDMAVKLDPEIRYFIRKGVKR